MNNLVSKNIRFLRKKNNISQQELAEKLGLSRSLIAYWETGKTSMSIKSLYNLSIILNVNMQELLETDLEFKNKKEMEEQDLLLFNKILIQNDILTNNHKLTIKEYNKIVKFIGNNIEFIIDNIE